jgi:hypothetical protein
MHKHTIGSPLAELGSGHSYTPQWVLDGGASGRRWITLEASANDVLRAGSGLATIGTFRVDVQAEGTRDGRRLPLFSRPTGRGRPAGRVP